METRNAIGTCDYRGENFDIRRKVWEALENALVLERERA